VRCGTNCHCCASPASTAAGPPSRRATSHGGWGASFALRLTSRPRCYSLLFPKNTAGNPTLAADFLGFGKNCRQNNSEKQRVKTATFCCQCRETASRIPPLSRLMETVKANIIGTGSLYTRWRQFSDRPSRFAQAYFLRCVRGLVVVTAFATHPPMQPRRPSSCQ
jgi:hypothetical protein